MVASLVPVVSNRGVIPQGSIVPHGIQVLFNGRGADAVAFASIQRFFACQSQFFFGRKWTCRIAQATVDGTVPDEGVFIRWHRL